MIGYFISGTSVGFLSFQAYKRRQQQKKTEAINELVQENYLSPQDWTEGEDVYSLQTQLLSQKLNSTYDKDKSPSKRYFDKTRSIISNKFLQLRMNQQIMMSRFYKKNNNNNNSQNISQDNQIDQNNNNQIQKPITSSPLKSIYQQFVESYMKKNEEKQLQQMKKQIISLNAGQKVINQGQEQQQIDGQSKSNIIDQEQIRQLVNEYNFDKSEQMKEQMYIPINRFENHFNESTVGKKSIVYTEYKGNNPNCALQQFLSKCSSYLPVQNAMIIHYYFGKGDPSSYVLAVEYNPVQNEGITNSINEIDGANIAVLKKTDAYKFNYDFRQTEQKTGINLEKWIKEQENQLLLKSVLEQEIESKIQVSGVRQMKYIELFSLDDSKNIINYQVQVPFGQNESSYDLRSKTSTTDIQYHDTFKQFDVQYQKP